MRRVSIDHGPAATALLIASGHKGGSRGSARYPIAMEVGEFDSLGREAVNLGSFEVLIIEAADAAIAHVIHHNDNDIGLLRGEAV